MVLLETNIISKNIKINGSTINVLRDIHFSVLKGEFITIIGPSGCGKTTVLKIIMGLENDYEGEILLCGKKISKPSLDRGIVFQDHRLLPWLTVEENIRFALPNENKKDERVSKVIQLVGLSGFETAWPRQLSGGMAQRVALARALINVPDIILLDEAFGSLDDFTRAKMQSELHRIVSQSQATAIMVTHNVDEAVMLSDKIIILSSKPASIIDVIIINMPHPRNKRSEQFTYYRNQLIKEL